MTITYSECGRSSDSTDIPCLAACNVPCNHNHDGTLCDICGEIADVESQIDALHFQLEELYKRNQSLRTKRNDMNIISKLSEDVASHIFILCLPPIEREFLADFEPPCLNFVTPHLPLRLSAVCRSWRRLAYSTPQLWSTLAIDIYQPNLQHIRHRLQWSGSAPLRVRLCASNAENPNPTFQTLEVILLVKKIIHRMAQLCVNLPCGYIRTFFSSQGSDIPDTLPALEELHFHCSTSGRRGLCTQPHDFILSINPPAPHKVFVTSFSLTNIRLNWSNVRHLSLEARAGGQPLIAEALSLLSEGKRLYVVDLIFYPDPGPLTGMAAVQNSIRNLRLFHTPAGTLSHITMPHLESLTLWQSQWDPTNPLLSFLQRSACPLKTMVWKPLGTDALPPEKAFLDIFRCTPKLQQLSLNLVDLIDPDLESNVLHFLEHLAGDPRPRNNSSDALLPLLQKFVYAGPTIHALPRLFLDIAEHRSGITSSTSKDAQVIQSLEELIIYRYQLDEDFEPLIGIDLARLLRLNAAGKNISVVEGNELQCGFVNVDFSSYY